MFDVSPAEIAQLNDTDLRELVGRLCEAELVSRGFSPVAVTWGGNQTAADGGLDVRVALPPGTAVDGFVPRGSTGFQVKTPDMPASAIAGEMKPKGKIRPVIEALADEAGAYVIVSSHGSTADGPLKSRKKAMRDAVDRVASGGQLFVDFYDRTRLATWVRLHPGLIAWVKEKIGRAYSGWRPYGAWCGAAEGIEAEYLIDDKLRMHLGRRRDEPARPVIDAIDELRDELRQPAKVVRLVGLSGVGKTRLVQALFDNRIGARPLAPSLAVYTNLSDHPDPQPTGLASDLLANRTTAVLIVDNCPPELHRRLSEVCSAPGSTLSVITVEYDVRDDQPEGTQVVTLDTSSVELIEKLVTRRYPHVSKVDAHTVAEASGGNARIAIAIAGTIQQSETIAGLSDDALFQRLFHQRNDPNDALLRAAQACSLVYSFDGESLTGEDAELSRLAVLADMAPRELYKHVSELLHRDLIQSRSVWRAVLPHAIANRLAARALDDIPCDHIEKQLVVVGAERLARSFSRRLSFLHGHRKAAAIVKRWLAPEGLMGSLTNLNDLGLAMFKNVAPVVPEATLSALERIRDAGLDAAVPVWLEHRSLLRSLAYDPTLFERSACLLMLAATAHADERRAKEAAETFASLFAIRLSGTHATIEQRLCVVENLLRSNDSKQQGLGLMALKKILNAAYFSSIQHFDFGAWSRDYGWEPQNHGDVTHWYEAALCLVERLAVDEGLLVTELRGVVAHSFRGLWIKAHIRGKLEDLCLKFAAQIFWREGWVSCRQVIRLDNERLAPADIARLSALDAELRPSNLAEQVRAVVFGDRWDGPDPEDMDVGEDLTGFDGLEAVARRLGSEVAIDDAVFAELVSDLLSGGGRAWAFGGGLASTAKDCRVMWNRLVAGLAQLRPEKRNVQVLRGFLSELWRNERDTAHELLDAAMDQEGLAEFVAVLHSAIQLDERCVNRLKQAIHAGLGPIGTYRNFAVGSTTEELSGTALKDLLLHIAGHAQGLDVAIEILSARLYSDRVAHRGHTSELLESGRELLQRFVFHQHGEHDAHDMAGIARACLVGPEGEATASEVARRLRDAVAAYETYAYDNDELLGALLESHPKAVLDRLFEGDRDDQGAGIKVFDHIEGHRSNPAGKISIEDLIAWCQVDGLTRFPLAASFISYSHHPVDGPQTWSEQALALLTRAPDPQSVLAVFIERFRPMRWSGSRAAAMDANTRLLGEVEKIPAVLVPYAAEARARLEKEIHSERESEAKHDRVNNERFE